ncbi:MAG TPA: hypothetical protein VGQ62_05805 [Chloroflexota bacterium]|nr:hypothetical protein [Chloroflexota bacterium]
MDTQNGAPRWTPVAREVLEYEMVPWVGREYAAWLRTAARPHPSDEHRLVLLPERIYRVFQSRPASRRVTPQQLAEMGFPRLPDEDELQFAFDQQRLAAQRGDVERLSVLHRRIEALQQQVERAQRAVETWRRADPTELEDSIARELASAPHADVHVGIPAEA